MKRVVCVLLIHKRRYVAILLLSRVRGRFPPLLTITPHAPQLTNYRPWSIYTNVLFPDHFFFKCTLKM